MQENEKKAFDFAADLTKQLIGLCTGIIALTIAFSKDFITKASGEGSSILFVAWGSFILSIFFGIVTLMTLTGHLMPKKDKAKITSADQSGSDRLNISDGKNKAPSIYEPNIRLWSIAQVITFILALVLTVISVNCSMGKESSQALHTQDSIMILERKTYYIPDSTEVDTLWLIR